MIYFTAGPSQTYPTVAQHLRNAADAGILSISHRGTAFMDIYGHMEQGLRGVLDIPDDYHVFVFSSATEIWERFSLNCIAQESFHLVNGSFSSSFQQIVALSGKTAHLHKVADGLGFDIPNLEVPEKAELIAAIANESSTGVMLPPADLELLRKKYPEKLLVVDAVSAVPTWQVDLRLLDGLYFSVQKGFGLPAGLGVLVLSPRLLERGLALEKSGQYCGSYHRFSSLLEKSQKRQTPATPNVLGIYLLGQVCADMLPQMDALRAAHTTKYDLLCDFIRNSPELDFAVVDPRHRSNTVVVAKHTLSDPKAKLKALAEQGYEIGAGYGKFADTQLRISNFPATTVEDVKGLMGAW
jgi:phosphoserine aminotransferase